MNRVDVLAALEPFKGHPLYPASCAAVLLDKRQVGVNFALAHADQIAEAMADATLEKRLR